jgi:preprotein translocase subunit SecD
MVKGFALTLFLGVAVSLFSAITVTRTLLIQLVNNGMMKTLTLYGVKHD